MKTKSIKESYKGLSFSTASKKISDKYKNRDFSAIEQRSFLAEMEALMKLQEVAKAKEIALETLNQNSKPRQASKFEFGGGLDPLKPSNYYNKLGDNFFSMENGISYLGEQRPGTDSKLINPSINPTGVNVPIQPQMNMTQLPSLNLPKSLESNPQLLMRPNLNGLQVKSTTPKEAITIPQGVDPAKMAGTTNKDNIYNPLIIGKAIEGIGKLGMLATGYDKVSPQYNPYEADIRRKMSTRGINMDAIRQRMLGQQNAGLDNTNNVRSEAVRQALSNSMFRGTQKNMADISLQEQQINNQYLADEANVLNSLGSARVSANNYSENLNNQSKMGFELGLQNALESAGQVGTELTNKKAQLRQQGLLSEVLKTKNFELANAEDVLAKAAKGEEVTLNDMIKIVTSQGGSKETASQLYMEYKKKYLGK